MIKVREALCLTALVTCSSTVGAGVTSAPIQGMTPPDYNQGMSPPDQSAQGQTKQSAKSTAPGALMNSMADTKFAQDAAAGGLAEVRLGQLAQEKGSSDAVKNFGKRMFDDHSKAGDHLKEVAAKNHIMLPSELEAQHQTTYDKLSKLSGAAFDKAYARDMVNDHTKDIADFKKEASDGKNDDIKNLASQTLPTLEAHLKMAREMLRTVLANSSASYPGGDGQ
jgi:putative membrane protein